MTEEEAMEKHCCGPLQMASALMVLEAGISRDMPALEDEYPSRGRCIGSACMAWRWNELVFSRRTELWSKSKGQRVNSAYSDDAEWRPVVGASPEEPPPPSGYCGLAGKP